MKMKMQQYLEMVKTLHDFGEQLANEYYKNNECQYDKFVSEVDCMTMHCDCCRQILEEALGGE